MDALFFAQARLSTASLILLLGLLMTGCQRNGLAPLVNDPELVIQTSSAAVPTLYTVQRGDTLYAIARRHKVSFRQIAEWNQLQKPYAIYPGQVLSINASTQTGTTPTQGTGQKIPIRQIDRRAFTKAQSSPISSSAYSAPVTTSCQNRQWRWPAQGRTQKTLSSTGKPGIDIFGRQGQAIYAAAEGKVIYSGEGVNGYHGNLIIIQHSSGHLSVYAYNQKRLVQENQRVSSGEKIATMGLNKARQAVLHFELRCHEQGLNPLALLGG